MITEAEGHVVQNLRSSSAMTSEKTREGTLWTQVLIFKGGERVIVQGDQDAVTEVCMFRDWGYFPMTRQEFEQLTRKYEKP